MVHHSGVTYGREEHAAWLRRRAEVTPREKREHAEASKKVAEWLGCLAAATQERMRVLEVRCPTRGCRLGQVYRFPLPEAGERFPFVGVTGAGRRHEGFLNWAFTDDWYGPTVWYEVGCRHGHGRLERAWLLGVVGLVRGWHHAMETVEEARAKAPEQDRKSIARRVFHPPLGMWRIR